MTKQQVEDNLQGIINKIVKEFEPEKIILFGSYAWGEPHEWSDVDLFIVKESNKSKIDRARDIRMALFGNGFPPMDLLVYTPQEVERRFSIGDSFINDIFTRGRILYAR